MKYKIKENSLSELDATDDDVTWKTINWINNNLSVNGATLCRLVAAGRVRVQRYPDRHPRYAAEDVVAYLQENKRIVHPHLPHGQALLAAIGNPARSARSGIAGDF
jgi:hypothetical protein